MKLEQNQFTLSLFIALLTLFLPVGPVIAGDRNRSESSLTATEASLVEYLKGAESWWSTSSDPAAPFALECRRNAGNLLPKVLRCLSKAGDSAVVDLVKAGVPTRTTAQASEWVRFAALRIIYALRGSAAPAIPELLIMLSDRQWDGRHAVACSFEFIGQSATSARDIAFLDLDSTSENIRQQGVILTAAGAKYDEAMITRLVNATKDPSTLVKQTAIGYLSHFIFFSPQAGEALFRIIKEGGDDGSYADQSLRVLEAEARLGRLYKVKYPDETRSLRPILDR